MIIIYLVNISLIDSKRLNYDRIELQRIQTKIKVSKLIYTKDIKKIY